MKNKLTNTMKGRVVVALLWALVLITVPYFFDFFGTLILVTLILIFGYHELLSVNKIKLIDSVTSTVGLLFILPSLLIPTAIFERNVELIYAYFIIMIITLSLIGYRHKQFDRLGIILVSSNVLGFGLGFLLLLSETFPIYIALLFAVWSFDTFSFLTGKLFGKNKISEVSPNKTWEGLFGGLIITTMLGMIIYFGLNLETYLSLGWFTIILLLTLASAFFGDLFFSNIKRNFQIKDFSNVLQSHGGILDRADSLLFASITLYSLVGLMLWIG